MRPRALRLLAHRSRGEEGQALVLMAAALVVLIGFAGLVVDIGRLYVAQRQLQQAVDAAALAAGQDMPHAIVAWGAATAFSAAPGEVNAHPLSMTAGAPTVTFECLTSLSSLPCSTDLDQTSCNPAGSATPVTIPATGQPTTTCNAVNVTETASVSTTLLHLFLPSGFTTVAASGTAAARGGVPHPLDIMVVIDTSGSMTDACNQPVLAEDGTTQVMSSSQSWKIDCAKDGVRRLLKGLLPCQESVLGNCGFSPPLDEVGLEVFPALTLPNGFTHDTTSTYNNKSLDLNGWGHTNICSGNLTSKPGWYTPNQTFPNWFLGSGDIGYPSDEVQTVTVSHATGGTFTLTFNGQTTAPIAWNASASSVYSALSVLTSITSVGGTIIVTGNAGGPFTVTFAGGMSDQAEPVMTANATGLTGTGHAVTVTETTKGSGTGTYLISGGLSNDFKLSNQSTTLNPASQIAEAVTWDGCTGGTVPPGNGMHYYGVNSPGGAGTYYAEAINVAQAALASDSARHAQPVIILLSDGDATVAPEGPNPCNQGIAAAQAAAQAGTWVYSIAYDSSTTTGCTLDTGITPFQTMQQIARNSLNPTQPDPSKFWCIPVPAGQTCNTATTLAGVFQSIGVDLTDSRLIPNQ